MGRQHIVDHHFDKIDLTLEVLFCTRPADCSRYQRTCDRGMLHAAPFEMN